MIIIPTVEYLMEAHRLLIERFGGSHGVRGDGIQLLDSALGALNHRLAYSSDLSVFEVAGLTCLRVAQAHPFVDGNKRIAATAYQMIVAQQGLEIAEGRSADFAHLLVAALSHDLTGEEFIAKASEIVVPAQQAPPPAPP